MSSFSAVIDEFARKVPGALDAIRKQSAQDIVQEMQTPVGAGGHMRVDTGFHRNSLMASTAAMPRINPMAQPEDGARYTYDGKQIELVILGSQLTDPLYIGYTAAYSGIREYFDGHIRLAAQNWQQTVYRNTMRVKTALDL